MTSPRLRSIVLRSLPALALLAAPVAAFALDPLHPLGSTTAESLIGRFVNVLLGLLGSISLVMFIWGGLTYMLAQGNEEKIKKAKSTLVYATLGLIVAFASFAILQFILNTVVGSALNVPSTAPTSH